MRQGRLCRANSAEGDEQDGAVVEADTESSLGGVLEPTPGFEPGTFSLPAGLQSLANSP
jgi:hypothetical protein